MMIEGWALALSRQTQSPILMYRPRTHCERTFWKADTDIALIESRSKRNGHVGSIHNRV